MHKYFKCKLDKRARLNSCQHVVFAKISSTFYFAYEMKKNIRNDHILTMPKIYDDKLTRIILFDASAIGFNEP